MAIDTSKAFGQSYIEGFRKTFKPKESPFAAASQKIADQIEAAKLKKEANQATINEMYGRVNVPTGTQMYGDDYAKAKEMTEFLTNEATLEKYAESPEMQREYARLVQQANAFVAESQDYYKTTYGTSLDPQKGNYLGYVARQNSPNYYENQGQQDNRTDYDDTFALLDTPSHDAGSFSVENGQFVFTQGGQTKTLSDVDHTNIDVFMPDLERTAFVSPSDFYQKNANLINKFSKGDTIDFVSGKIIGNTIAQQDALKSYNANHPEANYTVDDLATPAILEEVVGEYAEAVNNLRTPPRTSTSSSTTTTKKYASMPVEVADQNGNPSFNLNIGKYEYIGIDKDSGAITVFGSSLNTPPVKLDGKNPRVANQMQTVIDAKYGPGAFGEMMEALDPYSAKAAETSEAEETSTETVSRGSKGGRTTFRKKQIGRSSKTQKGEIPWELL